jgi:hypothetical protein
VLSWNYETTLLALQVGESFFIPAMDRQALSRKILAFADKAGINVVCRAALCDGVLGVRTWRVKRTFDTSEEE